MQCAKHGEDCPGRPLTTDEKGHGLLRSVTLHTHSAEEPREYFCLESCPDCLKGSLWLRRIVNCARCGGDHENLTARKLALPVLEPEPSDKVFYTHWVPCPNNGEPILVVEAQT